jgi:hypothetical protein
MLSLFRPSFEVVKEGRILKKIKPSQNKIVKVLPPICLNLNEGWY